MSDLFKSLMSLDAVDNRDIAVQRAPFGYVGGKSRSIPNLMPLLPYRDKWVDVFGGSGIVTLNRKRSKILDVYNDRASGVVAFYRCLVDKVKKDALLERMEYIIHAREEFVFCKATWQDVTDDVERAARWFVMISQSFIAKGDKWARSTNTPPPFRHNKDFNSIFTAIHYRMRECQIENLDYYLCMTDYDSHNTVFYCDPPYYGADQGAYECRFTQLEHKRLLELIHNRINGFVAVSSYHNDLYHSYKWDAIHEWPALVTANAKVGNEGNARDPDYDGNTLSTEVLFIKEATR